jgi:hypothetical protein
VLNECAVVFLLDVDNTLLDNDRFVADLGERLEQAFGTDQRERYWLFLLHLARNCSCVRATARHNPLTW